MTTPGTPSDAPAPAILAPSPSVEAKVVTPPAPAGAPAGSSTPPQQAPLRPSPQAMELQALRQQVQQAAAEKQAEQVRQNLGREAQSVYQEEIAQGQTPEEAMRIARRHYNLAMRVNQQEQALQQQQSYLQGRQNAAVHYGRLYGVNPSLLMAADTPQLMEQLARREKHYAGLEADVKALKVAQVPVQTLNNSNGDAGGGVAATSENIDKLWTDYDIAHPNQVNPYDAQYRKLLFGR